VNRAQVSSEGNKIEVFTEDRIKQEFGKVYDQTLEEHRADDIGFAEPIRHLSDWFLLYRNSDSKKELAVIPHSKNSTNFSSRYELHGYLEPNGKTSHSPLPIAIHELKAWSIDRTDSSRGIIILSNFARYRLKCPRQTPLTINDAPDLHESALGSLTMEQVHYRMRAMFGLVSNILDILGEKLNGAMDSYYTRIHVRRTPIDVYTMLKPNQEQQVFYPEVPLEPFDMNLLKHCAGFVRDHILQFHPMVTQDCEFIKGLDEMAAEFKAARKAKQPWTTASLDYLRSALDAERRSGRTPSGERIPGKEPPHPNKLLDILAESASSKAVSLPPQTEQVAKSKILGSHDIHDNHKYKNRTEEFSPVSNTLSTTPAKNPKPIILCPSSCSRHS